MKLTQEQIKRRDDRAHICATEAAGSDGEYELLFQAYRHAYTAGISEAQVLVDAMINIADANRPTEHVAQRWSRQDIIAIAREALANFRGEK